MICYYNKEGKSITMEEMISLHKDLSYKVIKQEILSNGKWVSTVWLGLDHQFGDGPPLIFETMIFPRKGEWSEEYCRRYSTLAQAKAGHEEAVEYGNQS